MLRMVVGRQLGALVICLYFACYQFLSEYLDLLALWIGGMGADGRDVKDVSIRGANDS